MCLVVIAHRVHAEYPLLIAGNRDEFHSRPTQDAHWWPDQPNVLGGRDLQAGGTWLAVHRNGRFATVTNFRDAEPSVAMLASRGELVTGFLLSDQAPNDFVSVVDGKRYGGFNLLVGDGRELAYLSNRNGDARLLSPGIYGVANATLDSPWAKVVRSKSLLHTMIESDNVNQTTLLRMLDDRTRARVEEVDASRLPFDKAHALTAPFVVLPDYGTRSSTVVIGDVGGNMTLTEKRFRPNGESIGQSDYRFQVDQAAS